MKKLEVYWQADASLHDAQLEMSQKAVEELEKTRKAWVKDGERAVKAAEKISEELQQKEVLIHLVIFFIQIM